MKKLSPRIRRISAFLIFTTCLLLLPGIASAQSTPDPANITELQTQLEQSRQEWLTLRSDSTASAETVQAAWMKFRAAQDAVRQAQGVGGNGNGQGLRRRDGSGNGQPQRRRLRDGSPSGQTDSSTSLTTTPAGSYSPTGRGVCDGTGQGNGQGSGRRGGGMGRGRGGR